MRILIVYVVPVVLLVLAVVWKKLAGNYKQKKRQALYERCISTNGRVRLVERWDSPWQSGALNKVWELEAEFEYGQKTYFAFSERQSSKPQYKVGDTITVYFDPEKPEDNMIIL